MKVCKWLALATLLTLLLMLPAWTGYAQEASPTIVLPSASVTLDELETYQLTPTLSNGETGAFTYESDSSNVTVDSTGLIKAINHFEYSTIIYVRESTYSLVQYFFVYVSATDTSPYYDADQYVLPIYIGESYPITASTVAGVPCGIAEFEERYPTGVISIDETTYTVTALKRGYSGQIYAKDAYGRTIREKSRDEYCIKFHVMQHPTELSIYRVVDADDLYVGEDTSYVIITTDSNDDPFTYTSSNTDVIRFPSDSSPSFVCVGLGKATVTVTSADGTLFDSVTLTVGLQKGIYAEEERVTLGEGESYQIVVRDLITKKKVSCRYGGWALGLLTVSKKGRVKCADNVGRDDNTTVRCVDSRGYECYIDFQLLYAPSALSFQRGMVGMNVGDTYATTLLCEPEGSALSKLKYVSSKPSVASVDKNGVITAHRAGEATIAASVYNGKKASCKVNVGVAPEYVKLFANTLTLNVGDAFSLRDNPPTFNEGASSDYTYSIEGDSAKLMDGGEGLYGAHTGTATLTVTTANGKTDTCVITVVRPPESWTVSTQHLTLTVGESYTFRYTFLPEGSYSSVSGYYDEHTEAIPPHDIIRINYATGYVKALKPGREYVMFEARGVLQRIDCTIDVVKEPTAVTLDKTFLSLGVGKQYALVVGFKGTTSDDIHVTFTSSKPSVATVSDTGVITAVAPGKATITVTAANRKKKTCAVQVAEPTESIAFASDSGTLVSGKKLKLKAVTAPDGASKTVRWTSSNADVATVSEKGVVTAKKTKVRAEAIITATTTDGTELSCQYTLTVVPKPTKLEILQGGEAVTKDTVTLSEQTELQLGARFTPSDAEAPVRWKSSSKKIATVDADGKVRLLKTGTVKITASSGGKSAKLTLDIRP